MRCKIDVPFRIVRAQCDLMVSASPWSSSSSPSSALTWNGHWRRPSTALLIVAVILGIVFHELIWDQAGDLRTQAILRHQVWLSCSLLTPYAHLKEMWRKCLSVGAFMPGFVLGYSPMF
jgi:hypothetical protein